MMKKRERGRRRVSTGKLLEQEFRKCPLWYKGDTIKWYEMAREPDLSLYYLFSLTCFCGSLHLVHSIFIWVMGVHFGKMLERS